MEYAGLLLRLDARFEVSKNKVTGGMAVSPIRFWSGFGAAATISAVAVVFAPQIGRSGIAAQVGPPVGEMARTPDGVGGIPVAEAVDFNQVTMPTVEQTMLLVRSSLLTLNDALQSDNFTVMRELAAPSFRNQNSDARLAQIFSNLVAQRIDLTSVAILQPKFTAAPSLDPHTNRFYVKGIYPGAPLGIAFELLYEPVQGRWRLFGISLNLIKSSIPQSANKSPVDPSRSNSVPTKQPAN